MGCGSNSFTFFTKYNLLLLLFFRFIYAAVFIIEVFVLIGRNRISLEKSFNLLNLFIVFLKSFFVFQYI